MHLSSPFFNFFSAEFLRDSPVFSKKCGRMLVWQNPTKFGKTTLFQKCVKGIVRIFRVKVTENPKLRYVRINLQKTLDKTYGHCYNNHRCHERDNKMRQKRSLKTIQRSKSREKNSQISERVNAWFAGRRGSALASANRRTANEDKGLNIRVWSWLRTNAGGVLNTCKSSGDDWGSSSEWN